MSLGAVALTGVSSCWRVAAEEIDSDLDWLEMLGVDTSGVLAEMVDGESLGDGANEELVGGAVRASFPWPPETPVPVSVVCSEPFPTTLSPPHL